MDAKSPFNAIARKLFPSSNAPSGDPEPGAVRRCDAGHVMDPGWESCPYCAATLASQQASQQASRGTDLDSPVSASNNRPTRIGGSGPARERVTRAEPPDSQGPPRMSRADTRRITGVLVTFTWQPAGQLFEVREGKNYIGAGNVGEEGDMPCHVQITTDPEMSNEHALILCRHGRYDLVDLNSSNGTFLNDQMVPMPGIELPDRAKVKTGSTVWRFLKIEEQPQPGPGPSPSPVSEPDQDDDPPVRAPGDPSVVR